MILLLPEKYCQLLSQAMRKEEHWQQVQATMQQHRQKVWRDERLPVPDSWQTLTNGSTTALRSLQLQMPNCRYNWALTTCIHDLQTLECLCTIAMHEVCNVCDVQMSTLNS